MLHDALALLGFEVGHDASHTTARSLELKAKGWGLSLS
jgi:hypothetical protein